MLSKTIFKIYFVANKDVTQILKSLDKHSEEGFRVRVGTNLLRNK